MKKNGIHDNLRKGLLAKIGMVERDEPKNVNLDSREGAFRKIAEFDLCGARPFTMDLDKLRKLARAALASATLPQGQKEGE